MAMALVPRRPLSRKPFDAQKQLSFKWMMFGNTGKYDRKGNGSLILARNSHSHQAQLTGFSQHQNPAHRELSSNGSQTWSCFCRLRSLRSPASPSSYSPASSARFHQATAKRPARSLTGRLPCQPLTATRKAAHCEHLGQEGGWDPPLKTLPD